MKKTKSEIIKELCDGFDYSLNTLRKMSLFELQELYDELHDDSLLFPNGRDYDAEDEDGI